MNTVKLSKCAWPFFIVIYERINLNFIEIALRHGWSPLNLLHISRTPFPKNTCGRLLLNNPFHASFQRIYFGTLAWNALAKVYLDFENLRFSNLAWFPLVVTRCDLSKQKQSLGNVPLKRYSLKISQNSQQNTLEGLFC